MRDWEEDAEGAGAQLLHGYLILNETPDAAGLDECRGYGQSLGM